MSTCKRVDDPAYRARETGAAVPGVEAVSKRLSFDEVSEEPEPLIDGFSWVPSQLASYKRRQLQSEAKKHGIKANGKSADMIKALVQMYKVRFSRASQAWRLRHAPLLRP